MVKLRGEDIKAWPIPAVDQGRQKAVAEKLATVASEVVELRKNIVRRTALLEERRRAVVTAAVTGELDVTTARRVS